MIISIDAEKTSDKIQHPFMILKKKKTLQKVAIKETYLNIIKVLYGKPTASIIANREKTKDARKKNHHLIESQDDLGLRETLASEGKFGMNW